MVLASFTVILGHLHGYAVTRCYHSSLTYLFSLNMVLSIIW